MVEEGELKKRIKALAEPDEEIFPYSSLEYRIDEIIDEAKKEFPIEFWWAVIGVDEEGETVEEQRIMPNAKLPENRANARIDKDKIIDWFLKWFGK
jgi:hypothetical protein